MDEIKFPQLPFLTREMLEFGSQARLQLAVDTFSSIATSVVLTGFTRSGLIKQTFTTGSTGALQTNTFGIPDFPIVISINRNAAGLREGRMYASIYLVVNGERVCQLAGGPVTSMRGVSYPHVVIEDAVPGRGQLITVSGANPAAGSEVSETFSDNGRVKVNSVRVTLVTDANVANRRPHFRFIDDGGNIAFETFASVDQTAGTSRVYNLAPFGVLLDDIDDNDILVPIPPDLQFYEQFTLETSTTNLQAGDNWGSPDFYFERWRNTQ